MQNLSRGGSGSISIAFGTTFTGDPAKPDEATRNFFAATYAQPGGMRAGFAQFAAFSQDAADNKTFERVKLPMPVLAVGGEKSFGPVQAVIMRHVAVNVQEAVVPRSGRWLMEESPDYTVNLLRTFLDSAQVARSNDNTAADSGEKRRPPIHLFPAQKPFNGFTFTYTLSHFTR